MDNKTRLRKIIARVIDNEWDFIEFMDDHFAGDMVNGISDNWFKFVSTNEMILQAILLNPDFLKAYFGEELICSQCGTKPIILVPKQCASNRLPYCPNCLHSFTTKVFPPNLVPACIHHAHEILDLILWGENPLVYFDKFEEEE